MKSNKIYQVSEFPIDKRTGEINKTFINMTGNKFGRLKVESYWGKDKYGHSFWNCICDCGNECIVKSNNLRKGETKSCGCFKIEKSKRALTHGLTNSPYYKTWVNMNNRCNDPNNKHFKRYGGRGISVFPDWNMSNPDGLENFVHYIEERMPIPSMEKGEGGNRLWSIDRIDNDGDYEPSNIRWATQSMQNKNRDFSNFKYRTAENRVRNPNGTFK